MASTRQHVLPSSPIESWCLGLVFREPRSMCKAGAVVALHSNPWQKVLICKKILPLWRFMCRFAHATFGEASVPPRTGHHWSGWPGTYASALSPIAIRPVVIACEANNLL